MSAWRMGYDAATQVVPRTMAVRVQASALGGAADADGTIAVDATVDDNPTRSTADLVQKAADVWTKWIPGDVLAVYLALTTAYRGTLDPDGGTAITPHGWGILVAGLCLAAGLSLLGGLSANLKEVDAAKHARPIEIAGRALLAILAFGFWSLSVPGSWWEVKGWDEGVRAAIAFAVSIVFALVAEMTVAVLKPGKP